MKLISSFFFSVVLLCGVVSCKDENIIVIDHPGDGGETCRIMPQSIYESCVEDFNSETFDVATWNIQFFPNQGSMTSGEVKNILKSFNADIIGVQEIDEPAALYKIIDELEDWEVQLVNNGHLSLGYIYNTCEIKAVSDIKLVTIGDSYIFPRYPVELTVTHTSGLEVTLINIHLKCCDSGNGEQRRQSASHELKDYIDSGYSDDNVIVLGDFNDEINLSSGPFSNFINDSNNYRFTDMDIAKGPTSNYSYPSWPSHLDHLLVTNELFDNIVKTRVLKFENCFSNYYSVISDHRPVILTLSED